LTRQSAILNAVMRGAVEKLEKLLGDEAADPSVVTTLRKVAAAKLDGTLERRIISAIQKRAGVLRMPEGTEATALAAAGGLAKRLSQLRSFFTDSGALQRATLLAKRLPLIRSRFAPLLDRFPDHEWVNLVEEFRGAHRIAAPADRGKVIEAFTHRINEILGIFHPKVIAELQRRAATAVRALRANPAFHRRFEIVSEEAKVLRFVLRAGSHPARSHLPTLQSVDGLGVLVVQHRKSKESFFVTLADIEVKSFNMDGLVGRSDGGLGQLITGMLRKMRRTDIALSSFEGGAISFDRLVDPARYGMRASLFEPIAVGQRALTGDEMGDLRRWGIVPLVTPHDTPTRTSEALARAIVGARFGER